jgi:hypothetical protein
MSARLASYRASLGADSVRTGCDETGRNRSKWESKTTFRLRPRRVCMINTTRRWIHGDRSKEIS